MTTKIIAWFALIVSVLSVVAVIGIVIAEMYVRWTINQNFTFLGGEALAALIVGAFALLITLSFLHRHASSR